MKKKYKGQYFYLHFRLYDFEERNNAKYISIYLKQDGKFKVVQL